MSLLHNDNIATVRWRSNRCPPTAFKRCVFYSTSLSAFAFLCGKAGVLLSLTSGSTLLLKRCVRLFTCKQASAATKLVPRWVSTLLIFFFCKFALLRLPAIYIFLSPFIAYSSGRLSQTSTASTQQVPTMATLTSSWRESTSTTTRPLAVNTCQELCWLIWSLAQWTQFARDHLDRFLDLTTLFLVRYRFELDNIKPFYSMGNCTYMGNRCYSVTPFLL